MSTVPYESIDAIFDGRETTIAKDLKLNLKRLLESGALAPDEGYLALLALATSLDCAPLAFLARRQLETLGIGTDKIQEAAESAAIVGMLNIYYRFRHMIGASEDYANAGLRMTALAKPANGKERFEMLAFALSILNGCEDCIRAHEKVLKEVGVGAAKIHDLARLAAVVKGVSALSQSSERRPIPDQN